MKDVQAKLNAASNSPTTAFIKQPIKFSLVGVVNTSVDLTAFWLLANLLGVPILIANTLSYSIGVLNSFVLNRLWTFRGSSDHISAVAQLPPFLLVNLVGLGIATATLWVAAQALPTMAAKLISIAATLAWNFTASKKLVFRNAAPMRTPSLSRAPGSSPCIPGQSQDAKARRSVCDPCNHKGFER